MATTTPNFGWPVPTSTDLVKDGATAIEGLGDAIDASLLDLKGGTTGQVLAKASNTDMDFTWSTDASGISPTIFAAKGDLLGASANDTPAVLTVGANGETLVADSSTSTGLRYQATKSTQNAIINGGMDIWQRGTSFTSTNVYSADRWYTFNASTTGSTFSRQAGTGEFQYLMRVARDSGNTSTGQRALWYSSAIEESTQFAGKTVTLSFYARKGANYSSASDLLNLNLYSGTGTSDVNRVNAAYTGDTLVLNNVNATLTTTLTRFSFTFTFGATVTQFGFGFNYTPVGTAGAADFFEITGVQLEVGSVATTFRRSGGTLQGELAACQRYYYRQSANASNAYASMAFGSATTTALVDAPTKLAQTMRVPPTSVDFANLGVSADNATIITVSAVTIVGGENTPDTPLVRFTATGLTQFRPYGVYSNNSTTAYLGFSAEL
jgi:hypothetical protein